MLAGLDLDGLLQVLAEGEGLDDGEAVDLLAHGLQCAAILTVAAPDDVELHVAGLVHDVGTILVPDAPEDHAGIGARAIERLLGPRVAWLVGGHVAAKRYLVTVEPAYRETLSAASVRSLLLQGGDADEATRAAIDEHPDRDALLALRRADDQAKVPGEPVPELSSWRPALSRVAQRQI